MKKCPKCGKEKERKEFNRNRSAKDGLSGWCKVCSRKGNKKYYKKNRKKIKKYLEENRKKIRKRRKKYYKKNRKKRIKYYKKNRKKIKKYLEENRKKIRKQQKKYREENLGKMREWRYKRQYNITVSEFNNQMQQQKGLCAICGKNIRGKSNRGYRKAVVDHTELNEIIVRGILCENCNFGLGKFFDNPVFLQAAKDYLENPPWKKKCRI